MKKTLKTAVGVAVLGLIAVGCGKGMSGTYSVTQANFCSQSSSPQINLNLHQDGDNVSGSGSNSCISSETLTGTDDGKGHLNNVVLTVIVSPQQSQYGYGSGYYGYSGYSGYNNYGNQTSVTCTYTGTLYFSNNVLSGSLNLQQNTQSSSYYYNNNSNSSSCPSMTPVNGSMTG